MSLQAPNELPSSRRPAWLREAPQDWRTGTLDRAALADAGKALREQPAFTAATRRFAGNMLDAFSASPALNRLLRTEGQLAFAAFVLMLDHRCDPADPSTGATYSRLLELFGWMGLGSPTLVKAIVALARLRGHVRVVQSGDRRLKTLAPTDRLLDTLRVWFRANLEAVEQILPLALPAGQMAGMPGLMQEVFTSNIQAYLHDRFILSEGFPPVRALMQRHHGYLVLMSLIQSRYRANDGAWHASSPVGELADRLNVSRGTVRNILGMAQDERWLTRIGRGGHEVVLAEHFAALCDDWMALEFTWMAGMANMAVAAFQGPPRQPADPIAFLSAANRPTQPQAV